MKNKATNLTKEQTETVERLVHLGDSEELAIETVLNTKTFSTELYETTFYS